MRSLIFKNIKRWLIEYGIDILDLMLIPVNTSTLDTTRRYENFMHEFNRHFSSGTFYRSNFSSHLPLLTVQIHDVGYSSPCHKEYILDFHYHYQTISAGGENTGENTPEALYEVEDRVDRYLSRMMESKTVSGGFIRKRTLFKDMMLVPNFDGVIHNVSSIEEYPLVNKKVEHEVNTLYKQFKITIMECN